MPPRRRLRAWASGLARSISSARNKFRACIRTSSNTSSSTSMHPGSIWFWDVGKSGEHRLVVEKSVLLSDVAAQLSPDMSDLDDHRDTWSAGSLFASQDKSKPQEGCCEVSLPISLQANAFSTLSVGLGVPG